MKQIKIAQDFNLDAPPPGVPTATSVAVAPATAPGKSSAPIVPSGVTAPLAAPTQTAGKTQAVSNRHVRHMQNEMLRLRSSLSIEDIKKNYKPGTEPGKEDSITESLNRHHSGKILSRHLATGPQPTSLAAVLKNIDHIGTPANPAAKISAKADGQWGDRTTAGLNSIVSLSLIIISIAGKFGVQLQFDNNDVNALKKLISNHKNIDDAAEEAASIITKITDSAHPFIQAIDNNISNSPGHSELQADYATEVKPKEELEKEFPNAIGIQLRSKLFPAPLNLSFLFSKDSLKQCIEQNKLQIDVNDDNALSDFLTSLENGIRNGTIVVENIPVQQNKR